ETPLLSAKKRFAFSNTRHSGSNPARLKGSPESSCGDQLPEDGASSVHAGPSDYIVWERTCRAKYVVSASKRVPAQYAGTFSYAFERTFVRSVRTNTSHNSLVSVTLKPAT